MHRVRVDVLMQWWPRANFACVICCTQAYGLHTDASWPVISVLASHKLYSLRKPSKLSRLKALGLLHGASQILYHDRGSDGF